MAAVANEPDQPRLRQIGRRIRRRLEANPAVQRLAIDNAELWAVPQFFDPLECGRLISVIDAAAKPSAIGGDGDLTGMRTSYTAEPDPRDPFLRALQQRIHDLLGIEPASAEPIRGQRYEVGQEFRTHTDWFPRDTAAGAREAQFGGQRSFTAMAYLNHVEGGGETDFPNLGIAIQPQPGALLVWNNADLDGLPNPWMLHAGNPVTRGIKYIVTQWYRCRAWVPH